MSDPLQTKVNRLMAAERLLLRVLSLKNAGVSFQREEYVALQWLITDGRRDVELANASRRRGGAVNELVLPWK